MSRVAEVGLMFANRKLLVAFMAPGTLLYTLFLLAPVMFFLAISVMKYDPIELYRPELTLENFGRIVLDPFYRDVVLLTLKIAALTTVFTLLIGYPVAYVLARGRSGWRGILMFLVVAPLMTGEIVRTYGWIVVLGSEGLVNRFLIALHVIHQPLKLLNTQTAVVVALVHILLPFMIFPLISSLASQDPDLVRAADTLGAGRLRAFVEVTLPLSRTGIMVGSLLVFTLAAGAVVTPTLLGGKDVEMLGQMIYDLVLHTLNWPLASACAFILLALQLCFVSLQIRANRRAIRRS
jgi:ABC-type spermidine/putrescine transport system permease subunit I